MRISADKLCTLDEMEQILIGAAQFVHYSPSLIRKLLLWEYDESRFLDDGDQKGAISYQFYQAYKQGYIQMMFPVYPTAAAFDAFCAVCGEIGQNCWSSEADDLFAQRLEYYFPDPNSEDGIHVHSGMLCRSCDSQVIDNNKAFASFRPVGERRGRGAASNLSDAFNAGLIYALDTKPKFVERIKANKQNWDGIRFDPRVWA